LGQVVGKSQVRAQSPSLSPNFGLQFGLQSESESDEMAGSKKLWISDLFTFLANKKITILSDYSVFTNNMDRNELLKGFQKLGDSLKSREAVTKEQHRLARLLMKNHPIHQFIETISKDKLTYLLNVSYKQDLPKMRRALALKYFEQHPKCPLKAMLKDLGTLNKNSSKVGILFENPKGNNLCYVNSCINALLFSETVLNQLKNGSNSLIVKSLIRLAEGNGTQNAGCFRKSVAEFFPDFNNNNQQDPMEFMYCLINILDCLKNLTRLKMQDTFQCDKCKVITIAFNGHFGCCSKYFKANALLIFGKSCL
jgi:hypothetical protein